MNEYNDRGERHGYWETKFSISNFHNGIRHGEYKRFLDVNKTEICIEGVYAIGIMVGCWKWYETDSELYLKEYYL